MDTYEDIRAEIDRILSEIDPFPTLAWRAIERGTEHVRWYAEQRRTLLEPGYRIEPAVADPLIRSMARKYLEAHGQLTVDEFQQHLVANLGLRTQIRAHDLRIWKSPSGTIPYPGDSRRKKGFLNGEFQLPMMLPEDAGEPANLVLLWVVGPEYKLKRLVLVRPLRAPDEIFGEVGVRWSHPLSHPATVLERKEDSETDGIERLPYREIVHEDDKDQTEEDRS